MKHEVISGSRNRPSLYTAGERWRRNLCLLRTKRLSCEVMRWRWKLIWCLIAAMSVILQWTYHGSHHDSLPVSCGRGHTERTQWDRDNSWDVTHVITRRDVASPPQLTPRSSVHRCPQCRSTNSSGGRRINWLKHVGNSARYVSVASRVCLIIIIIYEFLVRLLQSEHRCITWVR